VVIAFIAELAITFILMTVILHVSNNLRWHRFTGCPVPRFRNTICRLIS
jgi:glycerol uptake facilitator-like aquaporin